MAQMILGFIIHNAPWFRPTPPPHNIVSILIHMGCRPIPHAHGWFHCPQPPIGPPIHVRF